MFNMLCCSQLFRAYELPKLLVSPEALSAKIREAIFVLELEKAE